MRINLVDTPGHADFGGEVERVLNMVDAVLLIVDAVEGPMPQTRFVTEKAIGRGLKLILVVNKVDRHGAEPHKAVDATFDLLAGLDATEEQLDFPVIFTSATERFAMTDPDGEREPMTRVLDTVIEHAPAPVVDADKPPRCGCPRSTTTRTWATSRSVGSVPGKIAMGDKLALMRPDLEGGGKCEEVFRVSKVLGFQGLSRFELPAADAGDIVAVAGMTSLQVGDTLTTAEAESRTVFPALTVDPPTLTMRFRPNDGPFAGKEGQFVTSRKIRERLLRETKSNVALRVTDTENPEELEVAGRGELHLSVLIETMRREGYELCVSRPHVIEKTDAEGKATEPYERVVVQCDSEYSGAVIERLGKTGEMLAMDEDGPGRTKMEFRSPTRSLIGYRSEFLTATRGTGVLTSVFDSYGPSPRSAQAAPPRRDHRARAWRDRDLRTASPAGSRHALRRTPGRRLHGHDHRRAQP